MGGMSLLVNIQSKEAPIKVALKDVLWLPGISCRPLSTGKRFRVTEENLWTQSYLRFRKDGRKILLAEKKGFSTLSVSVQRNGNHTVLTCDSFANKKQR